MSEEELARGRPPRLRGVVICGAMIADPSDEDYGGISPSVRGMFGVPRAGSGCMECPVGAGCIEPIDWHDPSRENTPVEAMFTGQTGWKNLSWNIPQCRLGLPFLSDVKYHG